MSFRKWVVRGLVLLVLVGCVGAGVVYQQWTNPAAVRQQVVEMLEQQFPGAAVTLDGARLRLLGGVVLNELRLLRRGEGDKADFLHIPQANVDIDKELLSYGQFAVRRIDMHRPRVNIVRTRDGKWNVEGLIGKSDPRTPLPTLVIHDGSVVIEDHFTGPATWEIHDVQLTILNDPAECLSFTGTGKSETFGTLQIRGSWNRRSNDTTLNLQSAGLSISKELVQYALAQFPDNKLAGLHLEGQGDVRLDLSYQAGAAPAFKHDFRCQLRQASADHPKLPVPLHNLSATVHCTESKLVLERLKAAAGDGKVECKAWAELPNLEANYSAELTASYTPLTKELVDRLPAQASAVKRLYEQFNPHGVAKVQLSVDMCNGQPVRNFCKFEPDDISICFDRFRYPLDHVTGVVDYDALQHTTKLDLVGHAGTRPVSLRGYWNGKDLQTDAALEIAGDDIPLDKKLVDALAPDLQKVANSFHATGRGHVRGLVRRVPGSLDYLATYHVHFVDCAVKWDRFPYPLENVSGDLMVYPKNVYEFKNFHGSHHGGDVWVVGGNTQRDENGQKGKLVITVAGKNICLDADLRTALAGVPNLPGLAKTWDTFSPSGRIGFRADVECIPGQEQEPEMDVNVDVAGCAVEPSFFRYRLDDVTGQCRYHKHKVELNNFTARHNGSQMSFDKAIVDLYAGGGFYVELDDLRGNPILADESFLRPLPEALRRTCEAINLKDQPFALQTKLIVSQSGDAHVPAEIFWDGQLWVHDAELRAGVELNHVTGTVACRGLHNGKRMVGLCGNVYLNEATLFKQALRGVRSHLLVHEETPDVMDFALSAPIYGGDVSGLGRVEFNSLLRYEVDLTASQIQLEDFGRHNLGPTHQLSGIAAARLHLEGQGSGVEGLEGNGSIDVPYSPMTRLLNLPLLLDLLKFLGLRWPDRTAFEEAHAVFGIHGNRVSISKLDLLGNVVSLYGNGEVNLDGTDLGLDMYPSWGRAEQMLPSMVRGIPAAISRQLVRIEMRGKVGGQEGDLKFTKVPVPGLIDPLMQMRNRFVGK